MNTLCQIDIDIYANYMYTYKCEYSHKYTQKIMMIEIWQNS